MNYPCAKFGDFTFSRFGFIVQTNTQTESQTLLIALLTRLSSAWAIILSTKLLRSNLNRRYSNFRPLDRLYIREGNLIWLTTAMLIIVELRHISRLSVSRWSQRHVIDITLGWRRRSHVIVVLAATGSDDLTAQKSSHFGCRRDVKWRLALRVLRQRVGAVT